MKKIIFGLIILTLVVVVIVIYNPNSEWVEVSIGEDTILAEVARTDEERKRGLSGRDQLQEGYGLLMIYDTDEKHGIWMKDMNFSLDIIWISEEKKVIYLAEKASPDSYPKVFRPTEPARYVLEVNSGVVDDLNLKVGSQVNFEL